MKTFVIGFAIAAFMVVTAAKAAIVTVSGQIVWGPQSYSEYGNGDVVFRLSNSAPGCGAGFWLRSSDPGFKQNLAIVIGASLAEKVIGVHAYDDSLWPGSGSAFCRVYAVTVGVP